ncbi:tetrapyrrole methylase family protein [Parvularcula bermudensis HTCC2503]|uniref:Ribosomal RNA small subunit methyltransferase I n=1 Tax=Parvularcula bermudensis (strain ATCC BAA-594 / HTCC2503 / KCTC 12087) TaxID=314260 RepID=E0TD06_PARBH|nr:16S rRNA (cytidine(1402)-2'-O)-methyltransferase [Parvularcula bermudensis]ADM08665.1 tetrapyrrole methylase family protein [Parvularcula bermudensis HTCC2503]
MASSPPDRPPPRAATARLLAPGLYVAATPIGHLGDISQRLRETLASADLILCEDTRVAGRLLQAMAIDGVPLRRYDDHTGEQVRPLVLSRLAAGEALVLISDAGTPLISDPGYKLVRAARDAGAAVMTVPGPCAAIAALSIAGVPTDSFTFRGFPPAKAGARQRLIDRLAATEETQIFYETGPRLAGFLTEIAARLGDDCPVVIARELTKRYEEVVDGAAAALAKRYADAPPKGEIVVILPPQPPIEITEEEVEARMAKALQSLSLKDAAAEVAAATGRKRRDLYQAWRDRT